MADEICTLTYNCLAYFARSLARNDQRQPELSTLFCNPLIAKPRQLMASVFVHPARACVVVSLLEDEYPWVFVTSSCGQAFPNFQQNAPYDCARVRQNLIAQHGEVHN